MEGPEPNPALESARDAWVGTYIANRRMRSSFLRALQMAQHAMLTTNDRGGLTMSGPLAPPVHYVLQAEDLAVSEDGQQQMVLREDPTTGEPQIIAGSFAWDRVAGLADPRPHALLWGLAAAFGLLSVVGWMLGAISRHGLGGGPSPLTRRARVAGSLAGALIFVIPLGLLGYAHDVPSVFRLFTGVPAGLHFVTWLWVPLLAVAVCLPWFGLQADRRDVRAPLAHIHYWALTGLVWAMVASTWMYDVRPGAA